MTSSSHSPQEEKSDRPPLRQRLLFDTWLHELVAICISICCLVAIGGVLKAYDQRTSPQLKYGLTLNAIISILATASKSGLVFAVASSISQLKWCWMQRRNRRLQDLQFYDYASRGPSGSLILLCTRSGRSLASIGAIITVLAVAFDPFVQQLLRYPIRDVPKHSPTSFTKRALVFDARSSSTEFLSAIEAGIWSGASQFSSHPTCPSGNCTWLPFRSVGWCSKCEDITSSASVSGCSYTLDGDFPPRSNESHHNIYRYYREVPCSVVLDYGAPGRRPVQGRVKYSAYNSHPALITYAPTEIVWMANGTNAKASMTSNLDPHLVLHNTTFIGVENPLMVFAHASLKFIDESSLGKGLAISHAEQCVLSMCERTYNTSVLNGIASSTVLSTNWGAFQDYDLSKNKTVFGWNGNDSNPHAKGKFDPGDQYGLYWIANPKESGDVVLQSDSNNTDPKHSASWIEDTWHGKITRRISGSATIWGYWINGGWDGMPYPSNPYASTPWLLNYSSDAVEEIARVGLGTIVGNVAAALTQLGLDQTDATVSGTIGVSEVYVDVRWKWFMLPCLLELAGISFLLVTILVSKYQNVPTWKSSLYALLYHGLEREVLHEHAIEDTVSGMRQRARSVNVRLKMSDNGDRVALRREEEKDIVKS